jgi:hypothetical protein
MSKAKELLEKLNITNESSKLKKYQRNFILIEE